MDTDEHSMTRALESHPLANIFPLLDGKSYDEFCRDIETKGVLEPIWLYEGRILDGRNCYRACCDLGWECPSCEYDGTDPVGFVLSMNLQRRH